MRGGDLNTGALFSYVSCEARVAKDHPLRAIREIVNAALAVLSPEFEKLYARLGRLSIAPEKLLRALLLQVLYSVRSERQLMEQLAVSLVCQAGNGRVDLGRDGVHEEPRASGEGRDWAAAPRTAWPYQLVRMRGVAGQDIAVGRQVVDEPDLFRVSPGFMRIDTQTCLARGVQQPWRESCTITLQNAFSGEIPLRNRGRTTLIQVARYWTTHPSPRGEICDRRKSSFTTSQAGAGVTHSKAGTRGRQSRYQYPVRDGGDRRPLYQFRIGARLLPRASCSSRFLG
jgi:hypothetical protein